MKRNILQKFILFLVILMMTFIGSNKTIAQRRVADKELIGEWMLKSMQYEGEEKIICGKEFTQIKIYRANGEYAAATLFKNKNGTCSIIASDYGTYSFKNGKYIEMGRPGIVVMQNKTTYYGKWQNRHDVWKKSAVPAKLVNFIVEKCKVAHNNPKTMQDLMRKYVFTK
jgi:hypothetical protein